MSRREFRIPDGKLLFTSDDLQRRLNPNKSRAPQWRSPDWMREIRWPAGFLVALRAAYSANNRTALAFIMSEAQALYQAETKGLTAAAAAIRHELHTKYPGEPNASQSSGRPARQTVKIIED
jgi:hypothetical protein